MSHFLVSEWLGSKTGRNYEKKLLETQPHIRSATWTGVIRKATSWIDGGHRGLVMKSVQVDHTYTLFPLRIEHFASSYHLIASVHAGNSMVHSDCFLFDVNRFPFHRSHVVFQFSSRRSIA
jgi:hypothetical protein